MKGLRGHHFLWLALLAPVACGGDDEPAGPVEHDVDVVVRVDAASEAQCPHGGTVVHAGLDRNDNGVLDEGEIAESTPQCQDEDVAPAAPPEHLVHVVEQPAGTVCPGGGVAIRSGPDENGNGRLDIEEIAATEYVCDDALLTRMVPAGGRCASEGIAFQVGRDKDGDGMLGDAEVELTEVECGDVIWRDVVVDSEEELALLAGIRAIHGALWIGRVPIPSIELPALEHVGGGLVVSGGDALADVSLPALTRVGGDLEVSGNPALADVSLPALARVGGRLNVSGNPALAGVSLPALVAVGELVAVEENAALAHLDLAALDDIGGGLTLRENPALVESDLGALSRIGGAIVVRDNRALQTFDLSVFGRPDDVLITGNESLTDVAVRTSSSLSTSMQVGRVILQDNPGLVNAVLGATSFSSIHVSSNASLQEISIRSNRVAGDVILEDAPALHTVTLDSEGSGPVDDIQIGGVLRVAAPVSRLGVGGPSARVVVGRLVLEDTRLESIERMGIHVRGDAVVRRNPMLGRFGIMQVDGGLWIEDNDALGSFELLYNTGHMNGDVRIIDNDNLETAAGLGGARIVTGDLTIRGNASMTAPALHELEAVGGSVLIEGNPAMRYVTLSALRSIGGDLSVRGTAMTAWSGLENLAWVGGTAQISHNPELESVVLPALRGVSGTFSISENSVLREVSLDALRHADLRIEDNPSLPVCTVDVLFGQVDGDHGQQGNDESGVCQ